LHNIDRVDKDKFKLWPEA